MPKGVALLPEQSTVVVPYNVTFTVLFVSPSMYHNIFSNVRLFPGKVGNPTPKKMYEYCIAVVVMYGNPA